MESNCYLHLVQIILCSCFEDAETMLSDYETWVDPYRPQNSLMANKKKHARVSEVNLSVLSM